MRDPIIGIDLGTSNTVVAHIDAMGKPVVLADEQGLKIHPSVVSFHPNGGVVVGAAAKQRKVIDPQNTIYSVKRLIGRSFRSPEVKTAMQRSPFLIKEGENSSPMIVTRAGEFAVPEISAIILDYARNIAAERLNTVSANRAVVTVPASFNDAQRSATATAGQIANLEVVRVINEPTAAALAYGHERSLNSVIAVYDFGGGTFDITILRLADQVYEVLGTAGDTFLGGDDLDERIVDKMVAKFLTENRLDLRTNEVSMMRLRAVAEQTKIELSRRSRAVVRIDEIAYGPKGKPLDLNIEITRDEFVAQVSDIIDRTFPVCQEALALAGLGIDQIDDIILVGGTTKIPYVRDQVSRFFAKAPRTDVNPEDAVAVGAALQANVFERQLGKSAASVGAFELDQDTVEATSPQLSNPDDDISAPVQVPSELATGAPRIKRPTAGLGSPIPPAKPDTSYKLTRGGTRDLVGPKVGTIPPPASATLARMKPSGEATPPPGPPPMPPQKTTAPGMGAQPPPIPSTKQKTQMVPVVQRPPAAPTPAAPLPSVKPPPQVPPAPPALQPLPPPKPIPAGLQPLPRQAPPQPRPAPPAPMPAMPRTITGETNPSISGEIDSNPGTGTFPGLVLPNQPDSFTDEDHITLAPGDAPSSITDATQIPAASDSFAGDSFASEEPNMGTFTDFDTQERFVPPAPVASANRPVPAALHNARTMIAPPPQPPPPAAPSAYPPRLSSDFDDNEPSASVSVQPSSTAKGMGSAAANAPTMAPYPMQAPQYPQQVPIMPMPVAPTAPERPPVVLEVTPRGLGIGTVAGYCEELIRRNSRLPAAQKKMFTTSRDSQDLVRIVVCQGESRRMDNNTVIGDLILTNLPPRPRGETSIEVTFHLDASGILQVRARDAQTGREQSASLDLVGGMAQQDVAASRDRLAQLRR